MSEKIVTTKCPVCGGNSGYLSDAEERWRNLVAERNGLWEELAKKSELLVQAAQDRDKWHHEFLKVCVKLSELVPPLFPKEDNNAR